MDASILLTTYGRVQDCIKCLNSLLPQKNSKIEIILLDDLHIEDINLQSFCIKSEIQYIHTGHQKGGTPKWRVPGYALNIGAKMAKGDYLILGNAELLHKSKDTVKQMIKTEIVSYPRIYDQPCNGDLKYYKTFKKLEGKFPFFMGIPKQVFLDIGGYDEDFTGYAYEDADLAHRLELIINNIEVDADAIHLWNERGTRRKFAPNLSHELFEYNKKLYEDRKGIIKRNEGKNWGKL